MGKQMVFTLYWAICGGLVGVGLISFAGPLILLPAGVMLLYGALRVGPRGFWAFFLGFGLLPVFLMFYGDRLYGGCEVEGWHGWGLPAVVPDEPGGTYVPCGAIPESSLYIAAFYILVTLIGIVWGLAGLIRRRDLHDV